MTIESGQVLLHYRLVEKIGEGGMGMVWKAVDTTLDREVAIKILPEELAADPDRLARLEREARLLASLNQANIATVFGLHECDGIRFIAMELVTGEDLAKRLSRDPLPVEEAIEIAAQVAAALEAAHENDIIHRDLKPANIRLAPDGTVKVLDFGLAKAFSAEASEGDPALSPTLTLNQTRAGVILGTAAYMSPEQARGRPLDRRTDIWSFGCVLYECLTGRQPFSGETISDTVASILTATPDWTILPAAAPRSLRRLLRRCLEKDPRRRLRHMGDVTLELTESDEAPEESDGSAPRRRPAAWPWIAAAATIIAVTALAWSLLARRAEAPVPRFTQLTFERGDVDGAAFASDGQTVLYSAAWSGRETGVYLRRMDSYEPLPLDFGFARVADASGGGQVALIVDSSGSSTGQGTLAVASITGGGLRQLAEDVLDASFASGGSELAVSRLGAGACTIEFPLGQVLAKVAGQSYHVALSPDGRHVAYVDGPTVNDTRGRVAVVDMKGDFRHLTGTYEHVGGLGWTSDSNTVVFSAKSGVDSETVYSVPLDGAPRQLLTTPSDLTLLDVDRDGRLLVASGGHRIETWAEGPEGKVDLTIRGDAFPMDISPDGGLVAMSIQRGSVNYEAFLRPIDGGPPVHLGEGIPFAISPDGRWVAGALPHPSTPIILWPTAAGTVRRIATKASISGICWRSDGRSLILAAAPDGEPCRLWQVDLESEEWSPLSPRPVRANVGTAIFLSPDETEIAAFDGDGALRIFPVSGRESRPITGNRSGGILAGWGLDGRLYFQERYPSAPRIVRIDPQDGGREVWREIAPGDPAGIIALSGAHVARDGSTLIYGVIRDLSNLFVVEFR